VAKEDAELGEDEALATAFWGRVEALVVDFVG
jgi:hypothetical protein